MRAQRAARRGAGAGPRGGAGGQGGGGEPAGPQEVSWVGAGPGAFNRALVSSADVDTLARTRGGGGGLGPRGGRQRPRRSDLRPRGPAVCAQAGASRDAPGGWDWSFRTRGGRRSALGAGPPVQKLAPQKSGKEVGAVRGSPTAANGEGSGAGRGRAGPRGAEAATGRSRVQKGASREKCEESALFLPSLSPPVEKNKK